MGCLSIEISPVQPASLAVRTVSDARLSVAAVPPSRLTVTPVGQTALAVTPVGQAALSVRPAGQSSLVIDQVCAVIGGILTVLASSDGPLRTRSGGYILLDPAASPPDE